MLFKTNLKLRGVSFAAKKTSSLLLCCESSLAKSQRTFGNCATKSAGAREVY